MEIKLTEATQANIPVIQLLAQVIWNEHYPAIIGQTQVDYMLGKMYSGEALAEQMKNGHTFLLIQDEKENIGFISFSSSRPGELFIHKFYILGNRQGKGLGQKTFDLWRKTYNPSEVTLTVNRQNFKSINFYFKAGFTIKRVLDIDIGNGFVMNDFEMKWKK